METCLDIRLNAFEPGVGDMPDGWIHRKCIPFTIIVQPTRGSYVITGPDHTVRIATGEAALIAAEVPVAFAHHGIGGKPMAARWLHVQATWREVIEPGALVATPHRITGETARAIGDALGGLLGGPDPAGRMDQRFARTGFAYRVLGLALGSAPPHPRAERLLAAAARLGPLNAWMQEHVHENLGIADIARAAGLSRSRLHALCVEHLGQAPMAQLKDLRLAAAARDLLTTSDPVAEIATRTGFRNPFHFSREFRRRYGLPPREYRDEQRLAFG